MSKAKLTLKLVGKAISSLSKDAPEGAVTYDLVKGFSKKGNFSIYSYRDAAGKLLSRESHYLKGAEDLTEFRTYQYLENSRYTTLDSVLNGKKLDSDRSLLVFDSTKTSKDAWKFDIIQRSEFDDIHIINYLSPGKKAKNLSFDTFYDGDIPLGIRVHNTNRVLAKRNREYLPLVTSEFTPNVQQKVNHISAL